MNLFELQENLKNFSQDQLVNEMRNPSGSAPQYLILSELQRRRRIMNEEQAQMPRQASVAEEAVAAAGMPQGGLAQMAQAMAPETDVVQNTARMFGGGNVGGPDRPNVGLPEGTTGQDIVDFISRDPQAVLKAGTSSAADPISGILGFIQSGLSEGASQQGGPSQQELATQMNTGTTDSRMAALEQYKTLYGRPTLPVRGMSEGGDLRRIEDIIADRYDEDVARRERRADELYEGARGEDREYGSGFLGRILKNLAERDDRQNRRIANTLADPRGRNEIDREMADFMRSHSQTVGGFAEGGVVRMQPGGLAGISRDLRTYMNPNDRTTALLRNPLVMQQAEVMGMTPEEYAASLSRSRADALVAADLANQADLAAMSRAAEDRMMFGETPIGAIQSERTEEPMDETLRRILASSEAAIAQDTAAVPAFADRRAPDFVTAMPPEAARTMLSQSDLADDLRAARTADYNARTLAADAQRMGTALPREEIDRTPMTMEEAAAGEFAGLPESMTSQYYDQTTPRVPGIGLGDIAEAAGRGVFGDAAIDEIIRNQEAGRAREAGRLNAAEFEAEAEAADAETAALDRAILADQFEAEGEVADAEARLPVVDLTEQREGAGGGGGAGGAGGGAGGGMSSDDLYEQDKWLALAQFGLGLMSSRAPTLGQAIGEAGTTGIAALRQAREDRQGRIEAAQTRADRLAAAAARASSDEAEYPYRQIDDIINMAESYERRASDIVEENAGMAPVEGDPGYEDYINNLALANTYRNYAREAIGIQ